MSIRKSKCLTYHNEYNTTINWYIYLYIYIYIYDEHCEFGSEMNQGATAVWMDPALSSLLTSAPRYSFNQIHAVISITSTHPAFAVSVFSADSPNDKTAVRRLASGRRGPIVSSLCLFAPLDSTLPPAQTVVLLACWKSAWSWHYKISFCFCQAAVFIKRLRKKAGS